MAIPTNNKNKRAKEIWTWCIESALRTTLACTIVFLVTLYGPKPLKNQITFHAFSYVTTILIITDSTLGDTLYSCWVALYATAQTVGPAVLSLSLIGPERFTKWTISLAVAFASFVVVALPGIGATQVVLTKRIALGQIVIIYVVAFINGEKTEPVFHPLRVGASTFVGVFACVLALLLPFPRLACLKVKRSCRQLAENASGRLWHYVKAFCAQDNASACASISQAKLLSIDSKKLLQTVKRYQGSTKWETLPLRCIFMKPNNYMHAVEKLQELEIPLRGMEIALTTSSFPSRIRVEEEEGESKENIITSLQLEEHVNLTLKQIKNFCDHNALTFPKSNSSNKIIASLQTLQNIQITKTQNLPSLFFLFCMKLLHFKSLTKPTNLIQEKDQKSSTTSACTTTTTCKKNGFSLKLSTRRLIPALKCSISLGLAIFLGLVYSKENGYWSGLPVAITFALAREPTFKVANVKAQGTVLGTVYGVFGCFVFEKYIMPVRFLSLVPWFIFTSLLRRSGMYGQAGGVSAIIGAVLILGRKNFGPPTEFAIARIAETFIGLGCSIFVELLLQPTRASSLAKVQVSKCFGTLHACVSSIPTLGDVNKANNFFENQRRLKLEVSELEKFIGEAEVEPNFWFLPFNSTCYANLLGSLSKVVEFLLFSAHALVVIEQEPQNFGASCKECVKKIDGDLQLFKEMLGSLVKCFEDATFLKCLQVLENDHEMKRSTCDIELGKSPSTGKIFRILSSDETYHDEVDRVINSYIQHASEIVNKCREVGSGDDQKEELIMKGEIVILSLGALGFCMTNIAKETREIEKAIHELVQRENPSHLINLHEISCKIQAMYS